jgi:hypothetical protein
MLPDAVGSRHQDIAGADKVERDPQLRAGGDRGDLLGKDPLDASDLGSSANPPSALASVPSPVQPQRASLPA